MLTPQARARAKDSEALRLQRDVESLTKTISLHQRRTASLDDSLRQVRHEVEAKRKLLQTAVPSARDVQRLHDRATLLENRLLKEKVHLNKELQGNSQLKDQIDEERREKVRLLGLFQDLQRASTRLESEAKDLSTRSQSFDFQQVDCKQALLTLQDQTRRKIDEVEVRVLESTKESQRARSREPALRVSVDNEVFVDSIAVLRKLYKAWVDKVKEQKSAVEKYNRTVKLLTESFDEIREATGIPSIDDMVTAFIKAYNQEQDMNEILSHLGSETDSLKEMLGSLELQHQGQLKAHRNDLSKQRAELETLQSELHTLRDMYEARVQRQTLLRGEMQSIEDPVNRLLALFAACQVPPGLVFSPDGELTQRVNLVESALSYLLTYFSSGQGFPGLFQTSIGEKSFGDHLKVASPQHLAERGTADEAEEPLTEAEMRARAAKKVHFPPLT